MTHSLFGLTLARTGLGRTERGTTVALLLASNAPDIDIVTTANGAVSYLEWHRGPTHGPLGMVGLGLVVAVLVRLGRRTFDRSYTHAEGSFLRLWGIAVLGVVCHVLMDLPTSYGTRPLSPFLWTWFAEDWMPIIDVYLLMILVGGLWLGMGGRERAATRRAERFAFIAIALMIANYGVRAWSHHQAIVRAPGVFGSALPEPCPDRVPPDRWIDRWPDHVAAAPRDRTAGNCLVEIAALPAFASPFQWRLIARLSNAYEMREIDLFAGDRDPTIARPRLSVRFPNQWTPSVDRAATDPVSQVFLGFSRFPAAASVIEADGTAVVRWRDLRFVGDRDPPDRATGLFSVTVRLDARGTVTSARLGGT